MIQRGLACADRAEALHYLGHLNYYRLGVYWLFEADHASHAFKPGTRFADVLNPYVFDRELRLLVLDAIERVEVSVRTGWAYTLAHRYGPHAHLDANLFKKPARNWDYSQQSQKLETEARKSHETFLQHHYQKYDEPLPPLWAVVEIMTLGQLSKWYGNLRHGADRTRWRIAMTWTKPTSRPFCTTQRDPQFLRPPQPNMLELMVTGGIDLFRGVRMIIPPAWQKRFLETMDADLRVLRIQLHAHGAGRSGRCRVDRRPLRRLPARP